MYGKLKSEALWKLYLDKEIWTTYSLQTNKLEADKGYGMKNNWPLKWYSVLCILP